MALRLSAVRFWSAMAGIHNDFLTILLRMFLVVDAGLRRHDGVDWPKPG
jgi:hypothetical protein